MRKGKRRLLKVIIGLLIAGTAGIAAMIFINILVKASARDRLLNPDEAGNIEDIDCILILGAGVYEGGRPSHMLEDRLKQGIALYKAGVSGKLLMSGDHGRNNYDEVNVMKQYAIDAGVPSDDIFMDHAGFSTYESLYRARDIFKAERIIVVTQSYHLYRSLYVAEGLGLEAYGVPSDLREYAGQSGREAREVLARIKDFLYVIFRPEPTYLGDIIPVSGDGDFTND